MTCTLRVLGCSGGIGGELRTTSFLLNQNILIDAGTGVGDLSLDELREIDHVFLTHSHLDHICSLPFIADAVGGSRDVPLKIYGIYETIHALQEYIFNDVIWPDFTKIPSTKKPFVSFNLIEVDEPIQINGLTMTALPVNHSIAANAYAISSDSGALVFSGDTGVSDAFWQSVNQQKNLKHLIIETSFLDQEELAIITGHLSPSLLMGEIAKLDQQVAASDLQIWICHLKPDVGDVIMKEIAMLSQNTALKPQKLSRNTTLHF
ncbi:3',5'-cyclic-nucleotide phosphodiesterase [Polynucleobacter sp. JS-Fieb-80-E5]|uniref:3',5'-cyclic-nucleotide phosphodiesterase n=1 Tax=Polynucleobacter sp. JS-Fieb-80-E5 TaxID=2081050 RepID=UPI001C0C42DB|nr:3',5'-cyclic-nucleotide phosphodiesterase [Polynucleobacter sp. JS-Fieb-80-E5]MBU3617844.1 3',5'-cyclic-nucleotide phosphodiesterase [Polynucleobacter sp. JS-Fieb-80-E5]